MAVRRQAARKQKGWMLGKEAAPTGLKSPDFHSAQAEVGVSAWQMPDSGTGAPTSVATGETGWAVMCPPRSSKQDRFPPFPGDRLGRHSGYCLQRLPEVNHNLGLQNSAGGFSLGTRSLQRGNRKNKQLILRLCFNVTPKASTQGNTLPPHTRLEWND